MVQFCPCAVKDQGSKIHRGIGFITFASAGQTIFLRFGAMHLAFA